MLSNSGHCSVHIAQDTVVRLALPFPTHILTLSESAAEATEVKEGRGIFNSNLSTARDIAGESTSNRTDKGGAEQGTPPGAPLRADGPDEPKETAALGRTLTPGRINSISVPRMRKYAQRSSRYCPNSKTRGPAGWENRGHEALH